jgi:hypothetical protein
VHQAATKRLYNLDGSKFESHDTEIKIPVTFGQVNYELEHIQHKLSKRAPKMLVEQA